MKSIAVLASLALIVLLAAPSTSHEFTGTDPAAPGNHVCGGTADWTHEGGVSSTSLTLLDEDVVVYFHPPPHGAPNNQDPQPFLGVLWLEHNGLAGLQKNDFLCTSTETDDAEASPHPDLVVL